MDSVILLFLFSTPLVYFRVPRIWPFVVVRVCLCRFAFFPGLLFLFKASNFRFPSRGTRRPGVMYSDQFSIYQWGNSLSLCSCLPRYPANYKRTFWVQGLRPSTSSTPISCAYLANNKRTFRLQGLPVVTQVAPRESSENPILIPWFFVMVSFNIPYLDFFFWGWRATPPMRCHFRNDSLEKDHISYFRAPRAILVTPPTTSALSFCFLFLFLFFWPLNLIISL